MKRFRTGSGALLLAALAMSLLVSACTEDPEPCGPPPYVESRLPVSSTAEILVSNFKSAYENMSIDELVDQLDEDFKMILSEPTQELFDGSIGPWFNFTDMVTIHRNMFGGNPGVDARDNTVHPIASIEFDLMEQVLPWAEIPAGDEHFGGAEGKYAPFRVTIQFMNAERTHRYLVQQQVYFYVQPTPVDGDTTWTLLGLRRVVSKDSDETAWDIICALYR